MGSLSSAIPLGPPFCFFDSLIRILFTVVFFPKELAYSSFMLAGDSSQSLCFYALGCKKQWKEKRMEVVSELMDSDYNKSLSAARSDWCQL